MEINYIKPVAVDVFLICKDDTRPSFPVDNWIKKGQIVKLKFMTESPALNCNEDRAFIVSDLKGKEINPTESIKSLRESRFEQYMTIMLN